MKLYLIDGKGYWGDINSHPLPLTVEIFPKKDLAEAIVNGKRISVVDGIFTVASLDAPATAIIVNGIPCEPLLRKGGRVNACDTNLRGLLPCLVRLNDLEARISKIEKDHKQPDFFG